MRDSERLKMIDEWMDACAWRRLLMLRMLMLREATYRFNLTADPFAKAAPEKLAAFPPNWIEAARNWEQRPSRW